MATKRTVAEWHELARMLEQEARAARTADEAFTLSAAARVFRQRADAEAEADRLERERRAAEWHTRR